MILYTMMPHEYIFPENEESYVSQQIISCEAGELIVEQINPEQLRVVRLLSGNPHHYLNEKYTPGNIIQIKPRL